MGVWCYFSPIISAPDFPVYADAISWPILETLRSCGAPGMAQGGHDFASNKHRTKGRLTPALPIFGAPRGFRVAASFQHRLRTTSRNSAPLKNRGRGPGAGESTRVDEIG